MKVNVLAIEITLIICLLATISIIIDLICRLNKMFKDEEKNNE